MKPGHFEARKWAYRQTKEGTVVSFLVHPNDLDSAFAVASLGTRYMVAFAEIGDDEQPVEPKPQEPKARKRFDELPLSQQCALVCQDKGFHEWLAKAGMAREGDDVAAVVREMCGVFSRAELDKQPTAGKRWTDLHFRFLSETGRVTEMR